VHLRVATKYPNITRRYLRSRDITADVIKLAGSVELAALSGLADRVVDITETGETLRQNGLTEIDQVMPISSHLLVSPAHLKLRPKLIGRLIDALAAKVLP
jgi:ATP phosphoribosyltransferase